MQLIHLKQYLQLLGLMVYSIKLFVRCVLFALLIVYAGADVLIRETPMDVNESPITQHRVILLSNGDHSPKYSRMEGFYISSDAFALIAVDVLS